MSAAGSFRRERESGVLELLLVSPLGENQIISGRLGGLYGQFLPSFGLLLGVWMYFSSVIMGRAAGAVAFYAATFFALPVIGLYFSLRCRSFLSAFLWTLMTGLALPLLVPPLLSALWLVQVGLFHWRIRLSGREAFVQVLIAVFCWFRLHARLKQRAFSFNRGD
jgi:ABC-type Na+ efflux pump permease subunit